MPSSRTPVFSNVLMPYLFIRPSFFEQLHPNGQNPLCVQQISIKRNYIHFTEAVRALAPVGSFSPQLAMPPFRKAVTAPRMLLELPFPSYLL
ncbi:hypothetical protein AVEN_203175-1 [Araneus ventricosus]|uniref:Uncharacterized protein n=1 Tax=Araneus ventricosus TaxID=182803 RepID=A0A4Y2CI38_ARAVE|nr:hypothetical protein AVEN_203175-1 [Araneus ventricosus]